ncbi:MAG: iron-containing alcohol dehydrogenase [Chloroflexota bacterium]|mgnify:CR=1 FL=1|nr:iron-containing alcohol dehydrogenase [Chloroflexota bacterium]MQG04596.1 phosphonoacetaldehyde reductase [SAR202 cluster bacterium]|tara:strand:- start:3258 stop:4409 length:1152 start_codon:yes stop_codon:yes gene_type:complete
MTVNIDEFIKDGTSARIGINEWSKYKKKLQENLTKTVIITSKSCKKYLSDIDSEKVLEVRGEPTFQSVDKSLEEIYPIYKKANQEKDQMILIALGGGSVIDTAKILSLMLSNNIKTSMDALKKSNDSKLNEKVKIICVPSTAGTGAETTQFSTIWDKGEGLKYSIVSNKLNRVIILDSEVSLTLPNEIRISTSIDALCQLLESTWSKKADKFSIKSAKLGYQILKNNITNAINNPKNKDSKLSMLISSYLSGMSISKANTTLCHSISYPLTALLGMPHGLACGLTLIETIRFNSIEEDKFLTNTLQATNHGDSEELINEIEDILGRINFGKQLQIYKKDLEQNLDRILPLTTNTSRANNNPVKAEIEDIKNIIKRSINGISNS